MTDQEIFDFVVNHVRQQGHPALKNAGDPDSYCVFRNEHGDKCAVGCLIPDDEYHVDMEDWAWPDFMNNPVRDAIATRIGREVSEPTDSLLRALQSAHDNAASNTPEVGFVCIFNRMARRVAGEFNLSYTEQEA